MTDKSTEGRGLLTETEREAIAGERSDSFRYKTRSYLKRRIEKLEKDVEVLETHAPDMLDDLQEAVNIAGKNQTQEQPQTSTEAVERPHKAQLSAVETPTETADSHPVDPTEADLREALTQHFDSNAGPQTRRPTEAVIDFVILLHEQGPLAAKEVKEELYPQYEDHYSKAKSMMDSFNRYFSDIPGLEKPGRGEYDVASGRDILSECNND